MDRIPLMQIPVCSGNTTDLSFIYKAGCHQPLWPVFIFYILPFPHTADEQLQVDDIKAPSTPALSHQIAFVFKSLRNNGYVNKLC